MIRRSGIVWVLVTSRSMPPDADAAYHGRFGGLRD